MQYMPFGELFVEQQSSMNYYSPYKFGDKEKPARLCLFGGDEKMGYSYFGARDSDSDVLIWLGVHTLADQRSWLSPYSYCR